MKTTMKNIIVTLTTIVGIFTSLNAQSFDITAVKPGDKVAQSKLFAVDENKVLNVYDGFSFSIPSMRVEGDTFIVAKMQVAVTSTKPSQNIVAENFSLEQNFPNPFNPTTTIRYNVPEKAKVSVVLFDINGREVATLVNETKSNGSHDVQWNATNNFGAPVASGTYIYRMIASTDNGNTTVETKKMVLVR